MIELSSPSWCRAGRRRASPRGTSGWCAAAPRQPLDIIVDICADILQFYNLIRFSSDLTGSELKCVFYFYLRISALLYLQNRKQMRGSQPRSNQTRQSPAPSSVGCGRVHYLLYLLSLIQTSTALCRWVYTSSVAHWESAWSTLHLSFIYLVNMSMCIWKYIVHNDCRYIPNNR